MNEYLLALSITDGTPGQTFKLLTVYALTPERAADTAVLMGREADSPVHVEVMGVVEVEPEDDDDEYYCEYDGENDTCLDTVTVELDGTLTVDEITNALNAAVKAKMN